MRSLICCVVTIGLVGSLLARRTSAQGAYVFYATTTRVPRAWTSSKLRALRERRRRAGSRPSADPDRAVRITAVHPDPPRQSGAVLLFARCEDLARGHRRRIERAIQAALDPPCQSGPGAPRRRAAFRPRPRRSSRSPSCTRHCSICRRTSSAPIPSRTWREPPMAFAAASRQRHPSTSSRTRCSRRGLRL